MGVGKGLRKAARKMAVAACASFSSSSPAKTPDSNSSRWDSTPISSMGANQPNTATTTKKQNLCAICLEALTFSQGQAIFTAQCSHSFHFACISSNVRHGSVTCPICRAQWTQLPRNLNQPCPLSADPVLQILDDSIATFRVHRRSFLRSATYNDDDPVDPLPPSRPPRLQFSLLPLPPPPPFFKFTAPATYTYLCVKLANGPPVDLVLVVSLVGSNFRLLKQAMALVVSSLRPVDRLAVVACSSSAARVFPLRRMTLIGKRTALQVVERLFFTGQADSTEALKKGVKILEDRAYKNPHSCVLHLSDSSPTSLYTATDVQLPVPVHWFGLGALSGFVMHEFEEFLVRVVGGVVEDVQVRIGEGRVIRIGELRGNDEKRILLDLGHHDSVCVKYSYLEGGVEECNTTGEAWVDLQDKGEAYDANSAVNARIERGRTSSVESWDYHDPYMARRWAKHLHTYRL